MSVQQSCQCNSPVSSPNKRHPRIMDPRPGKDKRARTNEVERKRIWDALVADNRQLLRPANRRRTCTVWSARKC